MDLLLIILAILAIAVASMYRKEHMTNKDMMSALQQYGTKDDDSDKKSKSDTPPQQAIYGPQAQNPPPTPTSGIAKGKSANEATGTYPDIYGPEYQGVPGMKQSNCSKASSDDTSCDDTYDYNPDLKKAFPTSGPPQPFLTDFAKFQR